MFKQTRPENLQPINHHTSQSFHSPKKVSLSAGFSLSPSQQRFKDPANPTVFDQSIIQYNETLAHAL